jgi:hypothetical protein
VDFDRDEEDVESAVGTASSAVIMTIPNRGSIGGWHSEIIALSWQGSSINRKVWDV